MKRGLLAGLCCCLLITLSACTEVKDLTATTVTIVETVYEPIVVTEYVPYQVTVIQEVEVIREVEKIVIETVEVPVIEYIPTTYRTWETVEEFRAWFKQYNKGRVDGDCDDYAERLQRIALEQGYAVSIALVDQYGLYYGVKVRDANKGHAGCLVDIKGQYYYVEPYPWVDYIWPVVARD